MRTWLGGCEGPGQSTLVHARPRMCTLRPFTPWPPALRCARAAVQPGDLQVVHNHTQVHNRSAYEDHDVSGVRNTVGPYSHTRSPALADQPPPECAAGTPPALGGSCTHRVSHALHHNLSWQLLCTHTHTLTHMLSVRLSVCLSVCVVLQELDQRRHLLRLWVAPSAADGAHPLSPPFAELYHSTEPGSRGGIYIEGERHFHCQWQSHVMGGTDSVPEFGVECHGRVHTRVPVMGVCTHVCA